MKKSFAIAALALAMAAPTAVLADPSPPKHGGVVTTVGELSYELANKDGHATIYIIDHGKEYPVEGLSGKLTVLNGAEKTEVPLIADHGNMMYAKEDAKLKPGAKVVATITFPDKSVKTIRFAFK